MEKHTLFKMLMIALCITFSISTVYGSSLQGEPTTKEFRNALIKKEEDG